MLKKAGHATRGESLTRPLNQASEKSNEEEEKREEEEAKELNESSVTFLGTVALVSTLILTLTYSPGDPLVLDTASMSGKCENITIWRTCELSVTILEIYGLVGYMCAATCVATTLSSIALLIILSEIKKNSTERYVRDLGPLIRAPQIWMFLAIFMFSVHMILQMSLVLPRVHFWIAVVWLGCCFMVVALLVSPAGGRADKYKRRVMRWSQEFGVEEESASEEAEES